MQHAGAQQAASSVVRCCGKTAAIDRGFAVGQEGFPRDAGRIGNPLLVRVCVATGGRFLLDDGTVCFIEPGIDFVEFGLVLDLDAEMLDAGCRRRAARSRN